MDNCGKSKEADLVVFSAVIQDVLQVLNPETQAAVLCAMAGSWNAVLLH
jgi:hypothetical protein